MDQTYQLHMAPLQGYADHLYRRCHAQVYGACDACYTPFIRIEKGVPRRQDMSRLESAMGDGTNLVPQIIFNSVDEFKMLVDGIKQLGINRIDLNLGCPYPMQTRRGRGAGAMGNMPLIEQVAQLANDDPETIYSVKMRLGMESPDEWKTLLNVLNTMHLSHIAVHPRIAKQMYDGVLYPEQFDAIVAESANLVIWNGDILTLADIDRTIAEHPCIKGVMIGRGLLARPSLIAEYRQGQEWDDATRMSRLLEFHRLLLDAYEQTLCGQTQILQKIKPFWDYLEPVIGHKAAKTIRKSTSLERYRSCIENI